MRYHTVGRRVVALPHECLSWSVRGGQEKECVFKLSWPSTAEYRMMKLKKTPLLENHSFVSP